MLGTSAQTVVKLPVKVHPFSGGQIGALHLLEDAPRAFCRLRGHPLGRALHRDLLQGDPNLEDLLQHAAIERCHARPALRIENNKALCRQLVEGLPDRDHAAPILPGECLLPKALARRIHAIDDGFAQCLDGCLLPRLCLGHERHNI